MKSAYGLIIGILIGLTAGLLYGWVLQPVEYIDTAPDVLREDYRADYILMVAQAYQGDEDIELARIRLAALGPELPVNLLIEAIDYGLENGYSQGELDTLNRLATDLRAIPAAPEISSP
jgi:hypothetical protein